MIQNSQPREPVGEAPNDRIQVQGDVHRWPWHPSLQFDD